MATLRRRDDCSCRRHRDPNGRASAAVRQLAFLNASFETGIDNPIDAAIVSAGEQVGLSTACHGLRTRRSVLRSWARLFGLVLLSTVEMGTAVAIVTASWRLPRRPSVGSFAPDARRPSGRLR